VPRFAFEKFKQADDRLTTQMKSVGEVMAIGRTFQESLQKALRGLEAGVDGFNLKTVDPENDRRRARVSARRAALVCRRCVRASACRSRKFHSHTKIDPWFLAQIKEIVDLELKLEQRTLSSIAKEDLRALKRKGFSDRRLAYLLKVTEAEVRAQRHAMGIRPGLQARRHVRGGVRHEDRVHVFDVRGRMRGRAYRSQER
jgi:carbamoyl-phosphate synthase large subunit